MRLKMNSGEIEDQFGKRLGSVSGTDIRDASGRTVGTVHNNEVQDVQGRKIGSVHGSEVRDGSGRRVTTLAEAGKSIEGSDGGTTLAAVWLLFGR